MAEGFSCPSTFPSNESSPPNTPTKTTISLQGEMNELRAQVSTLAATLETFMIEQKESKTTLTTSIKDEMDKNNTKSGASPKLVGQGSQESRTQKATQVAKHNGSKSMNELDILSSPIKKKAKREFTPIPMSYADAFIRLNSMNFLQPIGPTADPPTDRCPIWWNANAFCIYHRGRGHDTQQCFRLKHKFQDMIDAGVGLNPSKNSD